MSYIQKNLLPDEKLFYKTHKHWVIFLFPAFWTIIGCALCLQKDVLVLLGYVLLFIAVYYWLAAYISFTTSEYGVTNKRVLIKTGFIQRETWETLVSKIATLEVKQSIMGRILGYGTLVIQNTGGGKDAFTEISNPLQFRRAVQQQTERMQVNLPPIAPTQTVTAVKDSEVDAIPKIIPTDHERL